MRVDRKIWGPGPWPGARVVVAYPGDDLDEAVLAELVANEPGTQPAADPVAEEGSVEPEPAAEPAPKPRRRRTKKAT